MRPKTGTRNKPDTLMTARLGNMAKEKREAQQGRPLLSHTCRIRDGAVKLPQPVHVVQHVHEAEGEDADHVDGERQQEQEEVAVVSPPDAVVDPGAVMIEILTELKKKKKQI